MKILLNAVFALALVGVAAPSIARAEDAPADAKKGKKDDKKKDDKKKDDKKDAKKDGGW
jgi:ribosomal protein L12E/L44/L45/RPP1/RPP2